MSSPKSIKGSIGEHKMIVDLLGKGYHVAKAVDPQCPFDLVAVTPTGEIKLIDVKTPSYRLKTKETWKKARKINRVLTETQKQLGIEIMEVTQ
jgi:hypothetical protein|tara:strand:+ start:96 stop:374 length:279 start_codon:yes stop_codon:yes gene_type:complete